MLKFLFNVLWFLILHIFYGTNDNLKGKICDTVEMLAGLKGLFIWWHAEAQKWFLELSVCKWQNLPSLGCEDGLVDKVLTRVPEVDSPKSVRWWALVNPLLEAETGVLRQDEERLLSFRDSSYAQTRVCFFSDPPQVCVLEIWSPGWGY